MIRSRALKIKLCLCDINQTFLPSLELPLRHKLNIKFATLLLEYNPLETKLIYHLCRIISSGTELLICGKSE